MMALGILGLDIRGIHGLVVIMITVVLSGFGRVMMVVTAVMAFTPRMSIFFVFL